MANSFNRLFPLRSPCSVCANTLGGRRATPEIRNILGGLHPPATSAATAQKTAGTSGTKQRPPAELPGSLFGSDRGSIPRWSIRRPGSSSALPGQQERSDAEHILCRKDERHKEPMKSAVESCRVPADGAIQADALVLMKPVSMAPFLAGANSLARLAGEGRLGAYYKIWSPDGPRIMSPLPPRRILPRLCCFRG